MMEKDVVIIGAGVAGLYLSKMLERKGISYITLEKNYFVGKYGNRVINKDVFRKVGLRYDDTIRPIKKMNFYSPSGIVLTHSSEDRGFVVNLREVEKTLYRSIINKDNIRLRQSVSKIDLENGVVRTQELEIKAKIIILAYGGVQKTFNITPEKPRLALCYAHEVEGNDDISIVLDNKITSGFYGWIIPIHDGTIEIGFGTTTPNGINFKDALYRLPQLYKYKDAKVVEKLGGYIPISVVKQKSGKNWILIGDASGGEPMLGGSIHKGIDEAILASFVIEKYLNNIVVSLEEYDELWNYIKLNIDKQEKVRMLLDSSENHEIDTSFNMLLKKPVNGEGLINDMFKNIISNLETVKRNKMVTY
ncbi:MAG: NAD(P)/FAD-dependent oxidoreductase [Candidatus Aenigmatarchaeota archaeon]